MDQLLSADERVRETQHRVKNSLQLVASMLSAQARQSRDAALVEGLRDAVSRIVAVAHLHENLQNQSEQVIHVDDYLRDICNDLTLAAGEGADRSGVAVDAEAVTLPGPDALALGLIVNELVTNALRHAYPGGDGPVEVSLAHNNGRIVLTVVDRGVGRIGACESLGLTFVRLLAQKLRGELEISDGAPGTHVSVAFVASDSKMSGVDEAAFLTHADTAGRDGPMSAALPRASAPPSLRRPELGGA
jgi:two-component sensor histidine kinase